MSDPGPTPGAEATPAPSTRVLQAVELAIVLSTAVVGLLLLTYAEKPDRLLFAAALSLGFMLPLVAGYLLPRWNQPLRRAFPFVLLACAGGLAQLWGMVVLDDPYASVEAWMFPLLAGYAVVFDRLARWGAAASERVAWPVALRILAPCLLLVPAALLWGWWPPVEEPFVTRADYLRSLRSDLRIYYPHWDSSEFDLVELSSRYEERIDAAEAVCGPHNEPCLPFLYALRDMLAELRNGHTEVIIAGDAGRPAFAIAPVQGQLVVTYVPEGSDAAAQGIERGMVVLEVDGLPAAQAVARVPPWLTAFASPETSLHKAQRKVAYGPAGKDVEVTLEREDGSLLTTRLERQPVTYHWESDPDEERSDIYGETTREGLAYIALTGFSGSELVDEFDRLLDGMFDAPGLILDLRENSGGSTLLVDEIVGRLVEASVRYAEPSCPFGPEVDLQDTCLEHEARPREPLFRGPVAVLIDRDVFSSGEIAAYTLCRVAGARCFGETTAGETDSSTKLLLPGGFARVSNNHFIPTVGLPIQGIGVSPHVSIQWSLEDLRAERDPVLEAATAWLLDRSPSDLALASSE